MYCYFVFFVFFSYFSWSFFLSLLYIVGKREFFLTMYLLWGCPFVFLYCICILELPLEAWKVKIHLVLHSGKLFFPHLFICIMFMFLLGFLRFILFYISYICEHFDNWIFYPSHLFSSLPIWVICSLYYIFCIYVHLSNFFYPSICLSFLFIIIFKYVLTCVTIRILFQVFYICVISILNFLQFYLCYSCCLIFQFVLKFL